MFDYSAGRKFDLVTSFGLIEHFDDSAEVIRQHARHVRPGGQVLITFPLHDGIYGRAMGWAAPDRLAQHNRMSLEDAVEAVAMIDHVEVRNAGCLGRIGLGATRVHQKLDGLFPGSRLALGIPVRGVELALQYVVPNSRSLSPYACLLLDVKDEVPGL